jgi:hypothetical protein
MPPTREMGVGSSFTWLAYDEDEVEQLRRVVEAFGDKGTLDPIGFGPIRDGIADMFFPGVSTIQTRARYLVLVPRIFQALEAARVPPAEFPARRRAAEVELIDSLLAGFAAAGASANDPKWLGIIGRNVRAGVRTPPSTIYWNGMRTFGIRRFPGATSAHARQLVAAYRSGAATLDEERQPIDDGHLLWDPAVPRAGELPDEVETFQLTVDESDYLTERIQQRCPDTLLAAMLQHPDALADAHAPWEVPVSLELGQRVEEARTFAVLLHGLQLLYNGLLLDRAVAELDLPRDSERRDELEGEYDAWTHDVEELDVDGQVALARYDRLIEELVVRGARIPPASQELFRVWLPAAAADPVAAYDDPGHADRVRVRERQLKGGLAKLTSRPALESWATRGELQAAGRLNFRWGNARRIVADIITGSGELG